MKTLVKTYFLMIFILSTGISSNLHAENQTVQDINRISIYNFRVVKNTAVDKQKKSNKDKISDKNFEYYSFIIPQSVFKLLSKEYGYEVTRKLEYFDSYKNNRENRKRIKELGKKDLVNFIITGVCTVNDNSIDISVTIIDTKGLEFRTFIKKTDETGVFFREITENISARLNENVSDINKINKERFRPSPIAALLDPLQKLSIGVDFGYLWVLDDFKGSYNNTHMVSPNITYSFTNNFAIKLTLDYIETNSEDKEITNNIDFSYLAGALGLSFRFWPLKNILALNFDISCGMAHSKIIIDNQEPFTYPLDTESSWDPYLSADLGLILNFEHIFIKIGATYRNIFYDDSDLRMAGGYAGFGLHF